MNENIGNLAKIEMPNENLIKNSKEEADEIDKYVWRTVDEDFFILVSIWARIYILRCKIRKIFWK